MGEEKETGPATQAGVLAVSPFPLLSHQNSPILPNCGRTEAPSLPVPSSPSGLLVKVQWLWDSMGPGEGSGLP